MGGKKQNKENVSSAESGAESGSEPEYVVERVVDKKYVKNKVSKTKILNTKEKEKKCVENRINKWHHFD